MELVTVPVAVTVTDPDPLLNTRTPYACPDTAPTVVEIFEPVAKLSRKIPAPADPVAEIAPPATKVIDPLPESLM